MFKSIGKLFKTVTDSIATVAGIFVNLSIIVMGIQAVGALYTIGKGIISSANPEV